MTVGLAFVGAGRWAAVLAQAARRAQGVRLVGCYDPSDAAASSWCRRFGGCRFASLEQLVGDPEVHGVVVVTPNRLHAEVTEFCLQRGKPVFVEKPLAASVAEARRLRDRVREAGVPLAVGHCARRLRGVRRLRAMVESGELGDLVLLEANYSNRRAWELPAGHWRADPEQGRGGPWLQLGVHHVDTLRYLAGPIVRVRAVAKRLVAPIPVEDTVAVLAEHATGPVASVGCSWVTPELFWIRVCGTRAVATFELDLRWWTRSHRADAHSRLVVWNGRRARRLALETGDMLAEELEEFAACVSGRTAPEVDVEEGLANVAVLEAALRSAHTGRAEEVQA